MEQHVTLETLGGGALAELFLAELDRVLENIADPNTDARQTREIIIKVGFKPAAERDAIHTTLKCASKLAGIKTVETRLYLGKQRGRLVAVESDPRQSNLFDPEGTEINNISPLKAVNDAR